MTVLPHELLNQIRRLQLRARRIVQTSFGGEYPSAFKGSGLTFDDVREYQAGDDVRRIDWNVTARVGSPFVKRYVEERELTIILVVDVSAGMAFSSTGISKRTVATEIAAVLAVCAAGHNDRVGYLASTDRVERYVRPGKGGGHILSLLRNVLFFSPAHSKTDHTDALELLNRVHRRRSIVFLISDFLGEIQGDLLRRTAHRHDLVAIRIADLRELDWPSVGLIRSRDFETNQDIIVDSHSARFTASFSHHSKRKAAEFGEWCQQSQIDLIDIDTSGHHFDRLLRYFRTRVRRSGGS